MQRAPSSGSNRADGVKRLGQLRGGGSHGDQRQGGGGAHFGVGQACHQRAARRRLAGQLHWHRQQLFGVRRTGRKTRPSVCRLAGQKLLLLGRPDRNHLDHYRVCRLVRVG